MAETNVKVKKTWFIHAKEGKIEDFYNMKSNKEVFHLILTNLS